MSWFGIGSIPGKQRRPVSHHQTPKQSPMSRQEAQIMSIPKRLNMRRAAHSHTNSRILSHREVGVLNSSGTSGVMMAVVHFSTPSTYRL